MVAVTAVVRLPLKLWLQEQAVTSLVPGTFQRQPLKLVSHEDVWLQEHRRVVVDQLAWSEVAALVASKRKCML